MARSKRIYKQWTRLLFGTKSHELLVFCFFLAVSFGFWLLQALNETLEREVQVSLNLDNVPPDVVIIDSLPPTLSVVIYDRGLTIARHSISNFFQPNRLEIDFTKCETKKNEAEVYISAADVRRMFGQIFAPTTKIQSYSPDTQSIQIEPDSVRVFAPVAMLDTMHSVYTEDFLIDGLHEAGSYHVGLHKQKLIKYEPEEINIKVNVGYYTEKTVRVPIIGLNFPAGRKLRTFPAQASITFRVESGRYHQMTADDFVLATTYEELMDNTADSKLLLHLKTVPEGVSNVRISPMEVDYLIEQVNVQANE